MLISRISNFSSPGRCLDHKAVADFLFESALADGGLVRDLALFEVCLIAADDLESLDLAGAEVLYLDGRTQTDFVDGNAVIVYDLRVVQGVLDLHDLCFHDRLFVLCLIVFGVLGKVALRTCLFQFLCHFCTADGYQKIQFFPAALLHRDFEICFFAIISCSFDSRQQVQNAKCRRGLVSRDGAALQ